MIGVILWSSASREKAVIWCEDHAALAYLQGRENLLAGHDWPEAGDLVELEFEAIAELRHARSVSLVSGAARSELPVLLRDIGQARSGQPGTGRPSLRLVSGSTLPAPDPCPPRIAAAG